MCELATDRSMSTLTTVMLLAMMATGFGTLRASEPGCPSLLIAAPNKDVGSVFNAGIVMEVAGGTGGITTEHVLWNQDTLQQDSCELWDSFGCALVTGDFNGDGFSDLAIGVPLEDLGDKEDAGVVHVINGDSGGGLAVGGDLLLDQDSSNFLTSAEEGDWFGSALAAADFNGDGFDDLAVGSRYEDLGSLGADAGEVVVIFGSTGGLDAAGSLWLIQQGIADNNEFGRALAAGDFDNDGYADLAIGAPGTTVQHVPAAGLVEVLYGSASGLARRTDISRWHQNIDGIPDECHEGDLFGTSLAAGDFNNDGYDDLVVGVPYEEVEGVDAAGLLHLIYGASGGLTAAGSWAYSQATFAYNYCEITDMFGEFFAVGDYNGDGHDDLAVGVPFEDMDDISNAGVVHVRNGGASGFGSALTVFERDIENRAILEAEDLFGMGVAAGDLNNDGYDDLVIGVPGQDLNGEIDAGTVNLLYGSSSGLSMDNDYLDLCTPGYTGGCESGAYFGWAMAVLPALPPIFRDDFETGTLSSWSSVVN